MNFYDILFNTDLVKLCYGLSSVSSQIISGNKRNISIVVLPAGAGGLPNKFWMFNFIIAVKYMIYMNLNESVKA